MNLYDGKGNLITIDSSEAKKRRIPWVHCQHRGYTASGCFEETIPAYYEAYLNGVRGFECDIQQTSDGVSICVHSNPITDANGNQYSIQSNTWDTLKALNLGTHAKYGVMHLCSLEELLDFCYYHDCFLVLDGIGSANEGRMVAELVVKHGMGGKCIYLHWNQTMSGILSDIANAELEVDKDAIINTDYLDGMSDPHYFDSINTKRINIGVNRTAITDAISKTIRENGWTLMLTNILASDNKSFLRFNPDYVMYYEDIKADSYSMEYINPLDFGKNIE